MFNLKRKVLFGLSVSMVLAMAIGSFALGESQTPASPRAVEAQSAVGATAGPFTVEGGTQGTDYDYANSVLTIHSGDLTISTNGETDEQIVVDGAATITLSGVNIDRSSITTTKPAALTITDNANFDVKILLADNTTNILKGANGDPAGTPGSPGIQKNGEGASIGTLTIGVPDGSTGTGTLEATGGYYAAGIGGGDHGNGSNITISGGEVTATGGYDGAGIGGGYQGSGSDITITGGEVTATGGYEGAGIGGGYQGSGSDITITGGEVTVNGGDYAAGIGGGYNGSGNDITISGGEVTATGGNYGAGIGGGISGNGSDITINGGVVTATGGTYGAGIGGGNGASNNGNGSNITISGGVVTANGGQNGAGIGGGIGGNGSDITISGGVVTANGGQNGAGIGGGNYGSGSNITINGGVVTATGGNNGSGIGDGNNPSTSGSGNSLNGDAVVLATSGNATKAALEGFVDAGGDSTITQGIVFTGLGTAFDYDGRATDITWDASGTMYGNVTLSQDLEIPANLTIPAGQILSIKEGKDVTLSEEDGVKYTVEGELRNNGIVTLPDDLEVNAEGKVTTAIIYDTQGGRITNADEYKTYQDSSEVKVYSELPNAEKDNCIFEGWYTEKDGEGTKIEETSLVLLNQHVLYASWTSNPEPTPEPSVDPDQGGDGSDANSKTGDSFAGIAALAILGLATTGAALLRKWK